MCMTQMLSSHIRSIDSFRSALDFHLLLPDELQECLWKIKLEEKGNVLDTPFLKYFIQNFIVLILDAFISPYSLWNETLCTKNNTLV